MSDYLKEFKDIKKMGELIEEIFELKKLYTSYKFREMKQHIINLMNKYSLETMLWNTINTVQPQSYYESYVSAEAFLKAQGEAIISKVVYKLNNK
ncbi:MAG: hypothetical protein NC182_04175 [Prevotella sp.]|nr:hypothetical protein [Staphylococcus sp.]MCM1350378.1 hypothetical protein [Prevotella sp.]